MGRIKNVIKRLLPAWIVELLREIKRLVRRAYTNHRDSKRNMEYIKQILMSRPIVKVELGRGDKKDGWVTIDLFGSADIVHDIVQGIPFPDNSVDMIYSSHFFEHLYKREVSFVLSECYRMLKPGGKISICVPDAAIYIRGYQQKESFDIDKFIVFEPARMIDSRIDIVNYMAYLDGHHRNMFDQENLIAILQKAGFENPHERDFDSTMDKSERDYESIYAEAAKPESLSEQIHERCVTASSANNP